MEWGARKEAASSGALAAPRGVLDMAATRAGNLARATPTLGARSCGAALSRAFTRRAWPPYMSSRPSSPTYATPRSDLSTRSLVPCREASAWPNTLR